MDEIGYSAPLKARERDEVLLDVHMRLGRIEAQLEALSDHESRIRKLEYRVWTIPSTFLAAVVAFVNVRLHIVL
jgi:hypothetical protein